MLLLFDLFTDSMGDWGFSPVVPCTTRLSTFSPLLSSSPLFRVSLYSLHWVSSLSFSTVLDNMGVFNETSGFMQFYFINTFFFFACTANLISLTVKVLAVLQNLMIWEGTKFCRLKQKSIPMLDTKHSEFKNRKSLVSESCLVLIRAAFVYCT